MLDKGQIKDWDGGPEKPVVDPAPAPASSVAAVLAGSGEAVPRHLGAFVWPLPHSGMHLILSSCSRSVPESSRLGATLPSTMEGLHFRS